MDFDSGCFARGAKLHLDGQDCNTWQQLITQVKNKELDSDRAIAIDQEAIEKVRSLPKNARTAAALFTKRYYAEWTTSSVISAEIRSNFKWDSLMSLSELITSNDSERITGGHHENK